MSTTTMMSNQHRRFVPPLGLCPSNKRRERDGFESFGMKPPTKKTTRRVTTPGSPEPKPPGPGSRNQLLAGYLAHEFLSRGTLFGQPWDPTRAESVPGSTESRGSKSSGSSQQAKAEPEAEEYQRYVEVADLLKTDGAHLPGIANPAQLADFLKL